MKRKFNEGILKLDEIGKLLEKKQDLEKYINLYKGYSKFCLGLHEVKKFFFFNVFF